MNEQLIERIRYHALARVDPLAFASASEADVDEAEKSLGFTLPDLLKACYLKVGNGGFGPGYGLIGVRDGYKSDLGTLVETLNAIKEGAEFDGDEWPQGLLPFCEWGSNIFSCVDCQDAQYPIYTSEYCVPRPQGHSLETFFELWIAGKSILDYKPSYVESIDIINPFTKTKSRVSKRRPK